MLPCIHSALNMGLLIMGAIMGRHVHCVWCRYVECLLRTSYPSPAAARAAVQISLIEACVEAHSQARHVCAPLLTPLSLCSRNDDDEALPTPTPNLLQTYS